VYRPGRVFLIKENIPTFSLCLGMFLGTRFRYSYAKASSLPLNTIANIAIKPIALEGALRIRRRSNLESNI